MDYNQKTSTNNQWQRASRIVIENPLPNDGLPGIAFMEEIVVQLEDGSFAKRPVGVVGEALINAGEFSNISEVVQLLDPVTGEPIEGATITYGQIQSVIYSIYLHVARKRDAQQAIQE